MLSDNLALEALGWFRRTMMWALAREVQRKPLLNNWRALKDYLQADMSHERHEVVRILYLDRWNRLVQDDRLSEGTIDESNVYVRTVMARALELGAAALLLVHNHPGGDAEPSRADIDLTRAMIAAGRILGISVLDHLIVGRTGISSLMNLQVI